MGTFRTIFRYGYQGSANISPSADDIKYHTMNIQLVFGANDLKSNDSQAEIGGV